MSGSLPHFGLDELSHAVKILAACALAYSITRLFHLPEGYWCLITVIIVTHPDLPGTLSASRDRLIGNDYRAQLSARSQLLSTYTEYRRSRSTPWAWCLW